MLQNVMLQLSFIILFAPLGAMAEYGDNDRKVSLCVLLKMGKGGYLFSVGLHYQKAQRPKNPDTFAFAVWV